MKRYSRKLMHSPLVDPPTDEYDYEDMLIEDIEDSQGKWVQYADVHDTIKKIEKEIEKYEEYKKGEEFIAGGNVFRWIYFAGHIDGLKSALKIINRECKE